MTTGISHSKKIKITDVFSTGYRCNTDDFMKSLNIRKYSSPFSYMVIDYKNALNFINNRFDNYLNFNYVINNNKYYWCENIWGRHLFFHKKCTLEDKSVIKVDTLDEICVWNHHNLFNDANTIKRRCDRLLEKLDNNPESTLLFCIHKIKDCNDYDLDFLNFFCKKQKCKMLFMVPLYSFDKEPTIMFKNENLLVIHFNSYYDGNGTAFSDERINWKLLENIINENYIFN